MRHPEKSESARRKMGARGQLSIEYLILIGLVLILITVPASIFLSTIAQSSIRGVLGRDQASQAGEAFVQSAKQVYYLGLYAQKRTVISMPENVEKLYLLRIDDAGKSYFYVVLRINDDGNAQNYFFLSDAPVTSDITTPGVSIADHSADVAECATATCSFIEFTGNALRPGKKEFLIESVQIGGEIMVRILPVVG